MSLPGGAENATRIIDADAFTAALRDFKRLLREAGEVLWVGVTLPWQLFKLLRAEETRREAAGYMVWGSALVVFAVPEIWASASGHQPWPTLSSTVGGIEERHDWAAIIVVGLIVFGAMRAVRVKLSTGGPELVAPGTPAAARAAAAALPARPMQSNPGRNLLSTPDGRLTHAPLAVYMGWFKYFVVAILLVLAGYLVPRIVDPSNKQLIGECLYGAMGLALFLIPGWLSYRLGQFVPFPTLFRSFQDVEARAKWLAVVVAAGLTVLLIHLVFYPWTAILPDLQHLHSYCETHPTAPPCKP